MGDLHWKQGSLGLLPAMLLLALVICVCLSSAKLVGRPSHQLETRVQPQDFRGVNIGGWLVLESWITPQLYADNGVKAGLGEWGFCQHVGKANCSSVLNQHWDTWVTFDHLKTLASVGVNWLRVP